jgi:hypothetical protein
MGFVAVVIALSFIRANPFKSIKPKQFPNSKNQTTETDRNTWQANYVKTAYKLKTDYLKKPYDVELLVAEDKYSLIKVSDLANILFGSYQVQSDRINLTANGRTIQFLINKRELIGYAVQDKVEKHALYSIPYPAVLIDGTPYVPVRSALRALGMGVYLNGDTIMFGSDMKPTDPNLIFEKFIQ